MLKYIIMFDKRLSKYITIAAMPLCLIYLELVLAVKTGFDFTVYRTAGILINAVGFGLVLCFLGTRFRSGKTNKWICFALAEILTIFFLIEYFSNDAYTAFMSVESIITGAGGVVGEFGDVVADVIKKGVGTILLFHVPALLLLVLCCCKSFRMKKTAGLSLGSLVFAAFFLSAGTSAITATHLAKNKYTYDFVFDDAVRNFGVSNALYLDVKYMITGIPETPKDYASAGNNKEEAVDYGKNQMAVDWGKTTSSDSSVQSLISYLNKTPADSKNEYTGLLKDKNVILITIESFSKELLREDYFPLLTRMATKGIVVEDYYHPFWGGSTTSGEAAILTGCIPMDGAKTIQKTIHNNNCYTLANILGKEGYRTVAYHNGDFDFYNRSVTHPALGFEKFYSYGTGMEKALHDTWPRSDLEMFEFITEDLKNYDKFCAYIMTFSGHGLYNFTGNEIAVKNKEAVKDLTYGKQINGYFACSLDFEYGMELLVKDLEERGVLEDTVFVMTADHYAYALQNGDAWHNDRNYLEDLFGYYPNTPMRRDHNALIIWSPCLEEREEPITVSGPCYAPDILPTVLNLMGADFDSRFYAGRDILSDTDPLVIWANSSWLTEEGFYDASTGKFTPAEGHQANPEYIEKIKEVVRDKVNYSRNSIRTDLFKYIEPNILPTVHTEE